MNTVLGLMGKTETALLGFITVLLLFIQLLFLNPTAPSSLSLVWLYFARCN